MFRCDRRCDGCDGKFGNFVRTKHSPQSGHADVPPALGQAAATTPPKNLSLLSSIHPQLSSAPATANHVPETQAYFPQLSSGRRRPCQLTVAAWSFGSPTGRRLATQSPKTIEAVFR